MFALRSPLMSARRPAPETEGVMFRYRLHSPDGDDLGGATYSVMIKPGKEIHLGAGQRFRVLDVRPALGGGQVAVRRAATEET